MHLLLALALTQDPLDEVREKLREKRVAEAKLDDTLLAFALNLLSDTAGYNIVVAPECKELENEKVSLTAEDISVGEALRKLLDPLKLALVFEDGELVACPRDQLNRIVDVSFHGTHSLLAEPPGGWSGDEAKAAQALGASLAIRTNELPLKGVLELVSTSLEIKMSCGDGVDGETPATIESPEASAIDGLRPWLVEHGLDLVVDGGGVKVVKAPAAPRGLESAVRDMARRDVSIKTAGGKAATLSEAIKAVSERCDLMVEIDEELLKSVDAPPKAGAAPGAGNAWEVLRAAAAARGLGLEWRGGRMKLRKTGELKGFITVKVRPAVNLLEEK